MPAMSDPIPVTLLTGFLGAGKTTLLNRLLHDPAAGRVAVVVNEFGEVGLDHDLIENAAEDVVLMPGGCLCCSIRGDLSKTLIGLLERRRRGELAFDRVMIETTGLADPGPVHHTLLVDPVLAPNFALDGIITAVDGTLGLSTLARHTEAQAQVAMADRLVLTKRDLTTAAARRALEARLAQFNPGAGRIWAEMGAVPSGVLFGLGAMRKAVAHDDALAWLGAPLPAAPLAADPLAGLSGLAVPKAPAVDLAAPSHHATDDRIATASIIIDAPIEAAVFDFWLETLIGLKGADILRLKGIVHLVGVANPHVFHGVQHIFDAPVPLENWPEGDRTSRVVIIARDIPRSELHENLALLRMRLKPGEGADNPGQGMTLQTLEMPF